MSEGKAQIELTPGRRTLASVALATGTFMQVLDTTIANVSIPTIAGNLGVSADQGTWVITSFAVANGIGLPLTGWLMGRYGVVRVFIISVVLFTIASLLCGMAWSLPSLVAFRVLQGAVSGPMIPGSQALLLMLFPPERKSAALGLWSMTTLIAPVCGPLLGGLISDNWTWPWIFLINGPVGAFCAFTCWRLLRHADTPTRKVPVDRMGIVLTVIWIGALQIVLDKGKDLDWFGSTFIVVLALVALVGFIAWLIWELTDKHPIVDLTLFKSRNFALGCIAMTAVYAAFYGNLVLMPLWLQTQMGYTATWAGLVTAPGGLIAIAITPFASRWVAKGDARHVATLAYIAFAASSLMRAKFNTQIGPMTLLLPQLVQGVALSTFFIAMVTLLLDGMPAHRVPAASGMSNFLRIIGASFGTSLTTTYWDRREVLHQTRLSEATSVFDPGLQQTIGQLHAAGLSEPAAVGVITRELIAQSYLLAALDLFWISAWLILGMLALVWMLPKPQGGKAPVVAAD
ncbi:DHA2 family multidrug resistance protein [Panacagrimonas perspica]|uniref:DHA2 family multidrug resistance protein n=1 Tax=Panacagrimonas perspica TaxID=381431 RepID=A0A4R7NZV9_9GAMM|nr:DHA2 family efflux MFS transporter permease subunit [Panacagrimonas perspica]TDU26903.1 DHA2 family multidrug resistance protein [Panacagrimonas perspica]THD03670.1 MFS transporter [Panacagrimonas perspica]